jgi:hypothetical protein
MPKSDSPDGVSLRTLSLTFILPKAKGGSPLIRHLAREIEPKQALRAALLSTDSRAKFYAAVMASAKPGTPSRNQWLHIHFLQRPTGKPPKPIADAFKRGRTVEWLLADLRERVPAETKVICEGRLSLSAIPAARGNLPVAIPLRVDGSELLLAGAEYRSRNPLGDPGLSSFRWAEREDRSLDVWLTYVVKWGEVSERPWLGEHKRMFQFAVGLL